MKKNILDSDRFESVELVQLYLIEASKWKSRSTEWISEGVKINGTYFQVLNICGECGKIQMLATYSVIKWHQNKIKMHELLE